MTRKRGTTLEASIETILAADLPASADPLLREQFEVARALARAAAVLGIYQKLPRSDPGAAELIAWQLSDVRKLGDRLERLKAVRDVTGTRQ